MLSKIPAQKGLEIRVYSKESEKRPQHTFLIGKAWDELRGSKYVGQTTTDGE
tara:strand:- start:555 stop:710 length:156 start_codon:yes stop_codon:yes gene_type:complete